MIAGAVPSSLEARFDGEMVPRRGSWMALRTKARQEKAVARYLVSVAAEYYLPLIRREKKARGRKVTASVPLFPGYVFLAGELDDGYDAIGTGRVCQLLTIPDQAQFIHEIVQIRNALVHKAPVELYPHAVIGRRGRVRSGPLRGLEGTITSFAGQERLVLQVAMLGQGAA
ncbi:MAG: transcription termination/antitermination protein NusG, partial [Planctomycetota bacterium]